jgi:cobalt-zinc-cadmium efflux system outer membrane protein
MNKKMKKIIYILGLLFLIPNTISYSQELLNQYLEKAAKNNPALKALFNEYQASLEVISQVGTLPDPQVTFGYFIQPVETRYGPQEARFSVSQMFPWFGTLNAKENVAIQSAKAKYEAFEEAKSKLYYEVKSAYFDLYVTVKAIQITQENLEILESFHRLAMIKTEAGMVSAVDGLRAEMEQADLENQLALLNDTWYLQTVKFNNLLNVDNASAIILPDTLWNNSFMLSKTALQDSILKGNYQLSKFDFQSEALKYKEQVAKKSGSPSFNIGLDYIAIGDTDNSMVSSGLSGKDAIMFPKMGITIPLYRVKYKAMVQEVVYLQQANNEQKTDKENMLETVFENAYKEYSDADRRIELLNKQINYALQALRILESEYTAGKTGFEEMLRMERKVLKYNLELEKARADKQSAISFIDYLMGK